MPDISEAYALYRDTVFKYLCRLSQNREMAEEMTQETFYRAIRQWKSFRGDSSVSTWLCAIAKRVYYSALRGRRGVPPPLLAEEPRPDLTETFVDRDLAMAAQRALHRLPEPYREVFTLRTFCDLSHQQIGELFQKSDSWSRVAYHRARLMLVEALKGENEHE